MRQSRRDTWDLIDEIRAAGTTVVLVTHFMDEAERLCDRIGILDGGVMRFVGRPEELIERTGGSVRVTFGLSDPERLTGLERLPGVAGIDRWGDRIEVRCDAAACVPVIAALHERSLHPADLRVQRPTLEDAFVAMGAAA